MTIDLKSVLAGLYPENSVGGQCVSFLHNLVDFPPIGDSFASKKRAVSNFGIPADQLNGDIRPGDIIITSEGTWLGLGNGHGAMVNFCNSVNLWLTESNFQKNGRVHHTRMLARNSPKIVGVIRGAFKFPLPKPKYQLQIRTTILFNNQPEWKSLLSKLAKLQDWFWQASGQQIQLILDYKQVNVSGWNTAFYGGDYARYEAIKADWIRQNVLPLAADSEIVLFVIGSRDWKGQVFNVPGAVEYGWQYSPQSPIMAMLVCDEDTKTPWYPELDGFVDIARHEIVHGLYSIGVDANKLPIGTDRTHQYYQSRQFEKVFADLDYARLALGLRLL